MNNKFDINTLIGFLLIGGILIYFSYFNPASPDSPQANSDAVEVLAEDSVHLNSGEELDASLAQVAAESDTAKASGEDSLQLLSLKKQYGVFAAAMLHPTEERVTLENEVLKLEISNHGGQIISAELKNYKTHDSLPLYLIKENSNLALLLDAGNKINTSDLYFKILNRSSDQVSMVLQGAEGQELRFEYRLKPNDYQIDWQLSSKNMAGILEQGESAMIWELKANRHEKNRDAEITQTEIQYRNYADADVESFNATGSDEEEVETSFDWIAYKQQFFSTIIDLQQGSFKNGQIGIMSLDEDQYTKYLRSSLVVQHNAGGEIDLPLSLYLGPNKYEVLDKYQRSYEELIPLGWGILGWINRGVVLTVFNFLEDYGLNYGLIILIIAVLIKMVLFPLTYSSYRSMAKMRVLKPEIDELNEKYDDAMKRQQAQMELYNKAGVSPLGGCLPMLLQFPILIALFQFFPSSIELRQQAFLWADDLSTYDSIYNLPFEIPFYGDHVSLFTLLMTVSTLIYTWMNQQLTGSASNQQFPQMKYIIYLMPIMFLGVFNSYASGLSYYYFVANMITFGQQFAIRSFIDEDKIKAKIAERKEQPKKENRLMRRLREAQEEQNRQQRRKK